MTHEDRKKDLLSAIVEHFIKTAQPVGSKTILLSYDFKVSPATVRSDMADLEDRGLLMQPHTSAGRVPTDKGYRIYVDELADYAKARTIANHTLGKLMAFTEAAKAKEQVQRAVGILSRATPNLVFATIPENDRTFFMGLSNILKQPEFLESPLQACRVMEVLEDSEHFIAGLQNLQPNEEIKIFIGEENILQGIESCSMILTAYETGGFSGAIGILGPKRMPYALNSALLEEMRSLLNTSQL